MYNESGFKNFCKNLSYNDCIYGFADYFSGGFINDIILRIIADEF